MIIVNARVGERTGFPNDTTSFGSGTFLPMGEIEDGNSSSPPSMGAGLDVDENKKSRTHSLEVSS